MSVTQLKPLRILISGAGIAGPTCAYWLRRSHPHASITIVERASEIRKEGQTIDVAFEGRRIFDMMGITERVMQSTTKEKGLEFIDSKGNVWGHFPQDEDGGSFTREIEIVRGELASILWEETRNMMDWRFGDFITSISQDEDGVDIEFDKGDKERYDLLIIADGLSSRTRAMAFDQDIRHPIKSLGQYIAGFSLSSDVKAGDGEWAKWFNAPRRRVILHRPDGNGRMRTSFVHIDYSSSTRSICSSKTSIDRQKEYFANLYNDAGWDSKRLIEKMMQAEDFYTYEVAQVKMDKWSTGRVVMIGDCASCPSPITGQGTNVAITQAYTLAAMISKFPNDHKKALEAYEDDLRGWVEGIQKLSPGTPRLACPETWWGVRILLTVTWAAGSLMRSSLFGFLGKLFVGEERPHTLQPVEVFGESAR